VADPTDDRTSLVSPAAPPAREFELDRFQLEAIAALDAGQSVLVSAPTGSGKTVVAEHAVERALAEGGKVFYTTPIKALSNQKFADLRRRHGADRVGLLTGDNAINGDAPVVVMTTEVLRNMIYARSRALDGLRFVVLDEVHYLQDAYRGPVWEEVIIHTPIDVKLVCLSATVSNAPELADWLSTVRGPTATVLEDRRPIELVNLFAVDDRTSERFHLIPTLVDGKPNPRGELFDQTAPRGATSSRDRTRRRYATPRRLDVIDELDQRDLLPAIYFIFSRAACDDAVQACAKAGLRLTTAEDRHQIRAIAERRVRGLSDQDLLVLGYDRWLAALESGVAAHHAGMVPPFKEAVEECFAAGLVKAVFATETLALGINMPARTVVIEKLTKWTGERHEFLTPGQYTQLTGRAGRRGIDEIGHAVVLWSPFVPFGDVASLAASRSFVLTSSFRPTFNMAANLVRRYSADEAHHLLNLSFAQYQSDRAVVRLETRAARREEALATLRERVSCDRGDVLEYLALVDAERERDGERRRGPAATDAHPFASLKPGDVIRVRGGKNAGRAAVLSVAQRRGGNLRVRGVTEARRILTLNEDDYDREPEVVGHVPLPEPFTPHSAAYQRKVAEALRRLPVRSGGRGRRGSPADAGERDTPAWRHPVADCPDRTEHLRAARQLRRAEREVAQLRREIDSHTESLALTFDRVLQLLDAWGYLDGWRLTERGERLVHIFHESDLLIAECLTEGLFDDLDVASLAGLASCFTYEHRSPLPPDPPWFPNDVVRHRVDHLVRLAGELNADEKRSRLPLTRMPDPSFFALAHAWAAGETLDHLLADEALSGGDFVRNAKQLIDLVRQIGDAAPDPATARTARAAADALFRGVVAAASQVDGADPAA
jgi:ATP-dependent RNA helicase HelY